MQRDYSASLISGNLARTYVVHLPLNYEPGRPVPLVLMFHGGGGAGRIMHRLTGMNALADQQHFLVVYPDGWQRRWADGRGTTPPDREGIDDVAFISALIETLATQFTLDPRRIYAAGISNGGFFSFRLGCLLSDKIAAIATVAATLPANLATNHPARRPVPLLFVHGTADAIVPAAGGMMRLGAGGHILSTTETAAFWAGRNGCAGGPVTENPPLLVDDGTHVQRTIYTDCAQNASVVFYNVINGGHTWPGGRQYAPVRAVGKTTRNLDATTLIWDFFKTHPMR